MQFPISSLIEPPVSMFPGSYAEPSVFSLKKQIGKRRRTRLNVKDITLRSNIPMMESTVAWYGWIQVFFEPKQWEYLADQFKQEFCKLYGMTLEPLLNIYLQAKRLRARHHTVMKMIAPKKIHYHRRVSGH
ncbi:macrophage erythroblast attacher [Quillaja saponaria]|uniref:Macrophage erythroblast attacher n=1 Tax=Quillaja saponaria TaxID=32244 RepID=A0AAD7VHQ7_QUISA|nr:macrophage erythroblast attacher [Quillaja saponaria]